MHLILVVTNFSKLAYFYGYYVVERFVGHGIGTLYHSEPLILHHGEYRVPNFDMFSTLFIVGIFQPTFDCID